MLTGRHLLALCVYLLILGPPAGVAAEGPASLVWAFFLKDEGGQVRSLAFDEPEGFAAGDLMRIYLQLQGKTYVYLYLHDSRQDLYLVFPPSPDFYSDGFPAGREFNIPSGRGWFTLDRGAGTERFYLLATNRRLFELEGLTDQFLLQRENRGLQEQLLAAIGRQVAALGETVDLEQSPVPVPYAGGQMTGNETVLRSQANRTWAGGDFSLVLDLINR